MSAASQPWLEQRIAGLSGRKPSISDVFRSELHPSARLVYAAMCFYGVATGRCWVAIPILAEHCGLSANGVRKTLHQLEEAGFISCVMASKGGRRKMPDGTSRGISSEYLLIPTGRTRKEPSTEFRVRTPHSVQGNEAEPSTQCADTLHSVSWNPPLSEGKRRIEEEYTKTPPSPPDLTDQEKPSGPQVDGEAGLCTQVKIDDAEHAIFDIWQERVSCLLTGRSRWPATDTPIAKITGNLRRDLKAALIQQGFSVAHMNHAFDFGELNGWRNWRLGLLRAATEFRERYGHERFPSCLPCRDTGVISAQQGSAPCPHCPEGGRVAEQELTNTEERERQWRDLGTSTVSSDCTLCAGTASYRGEPCVACQRDILLLQQPLRTLGHAEGGLR
jgi:hypothetical protein